jgi:threonine/homoserine/homoserine lactone efflux protein
MTPLAFGELVGIVIVVLLVIGLGYAFLAARARDFFTSAKALRRLNRTAGIMMATAAGFVAFRA